MAKSIDNALKYESRCSIMKFILGMIQYISDLDYQRRLWIEGIPGLLGSWEDITDEFDIDDFLKDMTPESDPEFGLSAHQIEELWKLRNIFDSYDPKVPKYDYADPKKILADPEWHKVVECAKETVKAFEGYKVPPDSQFDSHKTQLKFTLHAAYSMKTSCGSIRICQLPTPQALAMAALSWPAQPKPGMSVFYIPTETRLRV